ncbi:VOC family protein [Bacillus sp. H-16]|uniref:VOC family protein n=1 Tax=Alteribacter salitolerans TaxID=2912333 RepID=UPI001962D340|nr:VOC family protein [Alteribacter salitolerans]MBM7095112.1 VOC family protein [Alteribacter salitolerans]
MPVKHQIGGVFVIVRNMPRAVAWYRDILGLEPDEAFVKNTAEDCRTIYSISMGKTDLILDSMHRETLTPSPNHLFFFETDDIKRTYDYVKQKNARGVSEIEGHVDVSFFEVMDPEGNKVMFCETKS